MADVCKCSVIRPGSALSSLPMYDKFCKMILIRKKSQFFPPNKFQSKRNVPGMFSKKSRSIDAQLVEFRSKRSVRIPFKDGGFPAEKYLQEVERVVKITFPDSARISYIGNSTWRSRLRPIIFFSVSATPICDLKVFHEEKTKSLKLQSEKLVLEVFGLPIDVNNLDLEFSLKGDLTTSLETADSKLKSFNGSVSLGLKCNLPLPFSLMPESVVSPVGDGVLDRILGAMEGALVQGIIKDYNFWCRIQRSLQQSRSSFSLRSATT